MAVLTATAEHYQAQLLREDVLRDNHDRTRALLPGADNIVVAWQSVEQDRALLTLEVWYGNRKRVINDDVSLGCHTTPDETKAVLAYHFGRMGMRILRAIGEDDDRAAWELTRAKPSLSTELGDALDALDQILEQHGG